MGQNRYKKLFNNSLIFSIGDIGSKGITLLLVPLYTFHLTQSEYGTIDLIQVMINLLIPILSLSIFEAVLRYVMDKEDTSSVFTNCFFITFVSSMLITLVFTIIYLLTGNDILPYVCIILILHLFQSLYSQFIRGIGKVKVFAINGILLAFTIAIMNVVFIACLKLGIEGYLLSTVIGLVVSLLYINLNVNTLKYIKLSSFSMKMSKKLLNYSLPLMPNSIMWWIINASSRYFILLFAGTSFNGLFAVASKIPSVLSIFNSIFFKAWQLSAIEEYESSNKSTFYSTIFNYYQQFLFIVMGVILLFLKPIFEIAIGSDFYRAWEYVPFLLIAILFSSFSSFLGANYIASKETKGVFKSSIIGGVTNVTLNLITIPLFGVIGASFSSMISFLVMTIIRWHDTKKYIRLEYKYKNIFINFISICLQISTMYWNLERIIEFTLQLLILCLILVNNRIVLKSTIEMIKNKVNKKR
ncbi:lipopolysaccharide biosynthesis protein [Metabacillus idriensis]|uniref:lipopolysaccharide biosynthesis protein n=1 Tax=Metabacillus idriensis TaxID=324768 RepID=UPI00174D9745|nr:polysaccharide biosynthesis C-terminal domain-containing protein [Metabacillus idriensis]